MSVHTPPVPYPLELIVSVIRCIPASPALLHPRSRGSGIILMGAQRLSLVLLALLSAEHREGLLDNSQIAIRYAE
jgi:hypothetical protein